MRSEVDRAAKPPRQEFDGDRRHTATRVLAHVPALDGLRGAAVLLVVVHHVVSIFVPHWFGRHVPGAFLGVDLFFVLSGFLITALLLREHGEKHRISVPSFYRRRILRLFPALAVLLLAHAIYAVVTGLPLDVEWRSIAVVAAYVANWFQAASQPTADGLGHLWTLSVEEQFYLVWPFVTVLMLVFCRTLRSVLAVMVGAIAAVVVIRALVWEDGTNFFTLARFYMRTDLRADSILCGALAAHLWVRGRTPGREIRLAAWGAVAVMAWFVAVVPAEQGFLYKGGFTVFALAAAIVIVATVDGGWLGARALAARPLRAVGRVSYGLYLWHVPVFIAVRRYRGDLPTLGQIAIALTLSALATCASWYLVEQPFLRRKSRARALEPASPDAALDPGPVGLAQLPLQ